MINKRNITLTACILLNFVLTLFIAYLFGLLDQHVIALIPVRFALVSWLAGFMLVAWRISRDITNIVWALPFCLFVIATAFGMGFVCWFGIALILDILSYIIQGHQSDFRLAFYGWGITCWMICGLLVAYVLAFFSKVENVFSRFLGIKIASSLGEG